MENYFLYHRRQTKKNTNSLNLYLLMWTKVTDRKRNWRPLPKNPFILKRKFMSIHALEENFSRHGLSVLVFSDEATRTWSWKLGLLHTRWSFQASLSPYTGWPKFLLWLLSRSVQNQRTNSAVSDHFLVSAADNECLGE